MPDSTADPCTLQIFSRCITKQQHNNSWSKQRIAIALWEVWWPGLTEEIHGDFGVEPGDTQVETSLDPCGVGGCLIQGRSASSFPAAHFY